ncbi:MAG: endonuclease/exonuclease/phosphatase family protein [Bacteroidales bacterium]|nr:endonuclease/exonuclease/phosphatase family protein [Bacteroidales bacterium]
MNKKTFFVYLLFVTTVVFSQERKFKLQAIAFYNLENLFDTIPGENDKEYTPNGSAHWDTYKYTNKLANMSSVLSKIAVEKCKGGFAAIGVSEIENQTVLDDLVKQASIADRNYKTVRYDSPDRRGIDVALIYNPKIFVYEASQARALYVKFEPDFRTRDQLVVRGRIDGELFHIVVNHWPSRRGGEDRSSPMREAAAALAKSIVDSVEQVWPETKVVVMGDLNDDPSNISVSKILNAKRNQSDVKPGGLFNPFAEIHASGIGTLAYKGQWNLFDQIIINDKLLGTDRSQLQFFKAEIFSREFLKQQEGEYKGYPLRTSAGGVWLNGYSDHFPSIIYMIKEVK